VQRFFLTIFWLSIAVSLATFIGDDPYLPLGGILIILTLAPVIGVLYLVSRLFQSNAAKPVIRKGPTKSAYRNNLLIKTVTYNQEEKAVMKKVTNPKKLTSFDVIMILFILGCLYLLIRNLLWW
jgi:hypothetical protein